MDEKELNSFAKFLFKRLYGETLHIRVKINSRLKRTLAWFVVDKEPYIEVSKILTNQNVFIIGDILSHELTHYFLFKNNKPYDDSDIEFNSLTYKNGISRTCTTEIQDGVIKYNYYKYESKCKCGFKIESYFPVIDNDFRPILICPNCKEKMDYNFLQDEYLEYIPTFKIQIACEIYQERNKRQICMEERCEYEKNDI